MRKAALLLYYGLNRDILFSRMTGLISEAGREKELPKRKEAERKELCFETAGMLIEQGSRLGLKGNLWQGYLAWLIAVTENAFSLACERGEVPEGLNSAVTSDFSLLYSLFFTDLQALDRFLDQPCFSMLTNYVNEFAKKDPGPVQRLAESLKRAGNGNGFKEIVRSYYEGTGVGIFGLHKAFRPEYTKEEGVRFKPVTNPDTVSLSDLVGYELQKEKLRENTEAFVNGKAANNCLLFGPAGTGKSSSIKGLLTEYGDRRLRLIELYKQEMLALPGILEILRGRNYRFIIFMDDLSFEESETDYKYLKAVIEGGLEKKPENVLIYATSNRRHLIRESFKDREEGENDLHKNDTVQEKLSLAYRFGLTVYFGSPDQKEFQNIVKTLAGRNGIGMAESELYMEANRWELTHGGLSGRTAQAFINYLLQKS